MIEAARAEPPKPAVVAALPEAQPATKVETAPKPVVAEQIVVTPKVEAPKPEVIAIAPKPEPVPAPKVEVVLQSAVVAPEPKPEVVPPATQIAVTPKVEASKPEVIAIAPKLDSVPAPKVEVVAQSAVVAPEPRPEVVPPATQITVAPKVEASKPEVIAIAPKPDSVPAPKGEVVAQPSAVVPEPKREVVPPVTQIAVTPKVEAPKPEVIAIAPNPQPESAPKVEVVAQSAVVAPEPKLEVVPPASQIAVAPKVETSKPEVIAIAPKPEPAPVPKVELVAQPAVAAPEPKREVVPPATQIAVAPEVEAPKPEVIALASKPEPVPAPKVEVVAQPSLAVAPEITPAITPKPQTEPAPKVEAVSPPAVVAEPVRKPEASAQIAFAPKAETFKPDAVAAKRDEVAGSANETRAQSETVNKPKQDADVIQRIGAAPEVAQSKPDIVAVTPSPESLPFANAEAVTRPVEVAKPEPAADARQQIAPASKVDAPKPQVAAAAPPSPPAPEPEPAPQAAVVAEPKIVSVTAAESKSEAAIAPTVEPPMSQSVPAVAKPDVAPAPDVVVSAPTPPAPSVAIAQAKPAPPFVATIKPEDAAPAAAAAVVVKPMESASVPPVEVPSVAEATPEIERAPVRPLQDRPPVQVAAPPPTAPVAAPKSAPTEMIAQQTPAITTPAKAAEPVYVQGPAEPVAAAAPADEDAAAAALRFDIARYQVVGNTLLKPAEINKVLLAYTGRQKDFADVQRALEALQVAYSDKGYSAVQVNLPEQELERGEVRFEVLETRIGKIEIQGNELHTERNVLNSLTALRPGMSPNSIDIARNLKLANENASKQTQVALRAGSQDGEVDATVKLIEDDPVKYSVSMDNTGTYATGKYRSGFGYQNSNMFGRDHTLTMQYITNPEHPPTVTVFGLGYRIPLYASGNSIDLIAGYSDVTSGTVAQLFNVAGAGAVYGARYNQNLNRIDNYEHKITYGIDYKAFQSNVTFVGSTAPLVPDITVHPVSVTYSGLWRGTAHQVDFYATFSHNIPGGNDGTLSDFQQIRPGYPNPVRTDAKAGYNIIRAGANYTHQFWGEWQAHTAFSVQQSDDALIAGEQFGAGGVESVRGFDERYYSQDRGWRASFELYTPDIAPKLQWGGGRVKALAFIDTATLTRNDPQPGEVKGEDISSYGLGTRADDQNVQPEDGLRAGLPRWRNGHDPPDQGWPAQFEYVACGNGLGLLIPLKI